MLNIMEVQTILLTIKNPVALNIWVELHLFFRPRRTVFELWQFEAR